MPSDDIPYGRWFSFDGKVVCHEFGDWKYTVVHLPKKLATQLPLKKYPRLRVAGRINDVEFEGAWQPARGSWFLMVSKRLLKATGGKVGAKLSIDFTIIDQTHVAMPLALRQALDGHPRATTAWDELTPGKRRGWAFRVASAKRPETIQLRVEEVLRALLGEDAE